jgi:cytochrome oxidase assembly protein ShyY1
MYPLTEKRFADFFKQQPETGMGYWVVTAVLKNGRRYAQVLVNSGYVTRVKNYKDIPFTEHEIDHFVVTHEKWDFGGT